MLYYWQADFESGNLADYLTSWSGGTHIDGPSTYGLYLQACAWVNSGTFTKTITDTPELWMQFRFNFGAHNASNILIGFNKTGDADASKLTIWMGADGSIALTKGSFGGQEILAASAPGVDAIPHGVWVKLDIHAKLHNVSGIFTLSINDVPTLSYVGNTYVALGATTTIGSINGGCFFADFFNYDNIIVADSPIRPPIFVSFM
jgi:hypothetical protein